MAYHLSSSVYTQV